MPGKWPIHWVDPVGIFAIFSAGALLALGHHYFYEFMNESKVSTTTMLGSHLSEQLAEIVVGNFDQVEMPALTRKVHIGTAMSVVTLGEDPPKLNQEVVKSLGSKAGISIPREHVDDFATLLGAFDQAVQQVLEEEDYVPKPDLDKYTRYETEGSADKDETGWAARCTAECIEPKHDLLKGRTIALKDNIALAGIKCTNGTTAIDWTPEIDATVATRIMDAGGIITGKATCENMCMEGVSDTSCTGKVHNPYADNYSAGGSSSGCGRLVAIGAVEMAVGCDQGGSIRIPSANCGIVGLKPTWGLVPYTGIISFECTIDHAGPMARSVRDAALLLEAIAGTDGIDDRQPPYLPPGTLEFTSQLDSWMRSADSTKPLAGFKVGVLEEGFTTPNMDPNVDKLCKEALHKLESLGAEITRVSIPFHTRAAIVAMCYLAIGGARQGIFQDMTGRKQLYMLERVIASQPPCLQEKFDAFGPSAQNGLLRYLYVEEKYGPKLHAKCSNLLRKINDDYNKALASVDVLVMPTLPIPPCRLFDDPPAHGPFERLTRNVGFIGNTLPFNTTGHPALTIPVGFVPARGDKNIKLPAGLQIVGKKFADIDCLKAGAAFERFYDWKGL